MATGDDSLVNALQLQGHRSYVHRVNTPHNIYQLFTPYWWAPQFLKEAPVKHSILCLLVVSCQLEGYCCCFLIIICTN